MEIYGPAHLHGPQSVNPPHHQRSANPTQAAAPQASGDELQLSQAGQIAAGLNEVSDIRHDRVSAAREAIAAGTYETDEKINVAIDRLLDEIG